MGEIMAAIWRKKDEKVGGSGSGSGSGSEERTRLSETF